MEPYVPAEWVLILFAKLQRINDSQYLKRLRVIERARWMRLLEELNSNENVLDSGADTH